MLMTAPSSEKVNFPVFQKKQNTLSAEKKFIAYYRVSTQAQGQSGLGLAAQETAVRRGVGEVEQSFTEIETGK